MWASVATLVLSLYYFEHISVQPLPLVLLVGVTSALLGDLRRWGGRLEEHFQGYFLERWRSKRRSAGQSAALGIPGRLPGTTAAGAANSGGATSLPRRPHPDGQRGWPAAQPRETAKGVARLSDLKCAGRDGNENTQQGRGGTGRAGGDRGE
eukprot:5629585-Pyramimonas_sp.AAC.1